MMDIFASNNAHLESIAKKHNQKFEFVEMLYQHAKSNQNHKEYFKTHDVSDEMKEDILFASKELTVGELIELLSHFPRDLVVVNEGYESGFESAVGATQINISFDVHKEWYYGKHEKEDDSKESVLLIQTTRGWRR